MKTYLLYPTEEQEKLISSFLESNHISFFEDDEELPDYVLAGIKKGQADAKAGQTVTLEQFTQRFSSAE